MAVKGIDISSHQGSVDFRKVRKAGYRFVFVKLTEGLGYVDPSYGTGGSSAERIHRLKVRVEAARKAGLLVGGYHFARPDNRPSVQGAVNEADAFYAVAKKVGLQRAPLVLDFETKPAREAWASAFCTRIAKLRAGRGAVTYTGRFMYGTQPAPRNGRMLWLAAYVPAALARVYAGQMRGFNFKFWQYTDREAVPGVGKCDANIYRGTIDELRAWWVAKPPKPRPKPKPKPRPTPPKPPVKPKPKPHYKKLDVEAHRKMLRQIGFPTGNNADVRLFQRGWAGKVPLKADGVLGPKTAIAIRWSHQRGGSLGANAPHFKYREWKSKGNGVIKVTRRQAIAMEKYRRAIGRPVTIVSGYRDPAHNRRVGGASRSWHTDVPGDHEGGHANDIPGVLTYGQMVKLRLFTGVGVSRRSGKVIHVDTGHNAPTHAPILWYYP